MSMQIYFKKLFFFLLLISSIHSASRDPVRARNGMVVSASEHASRVGAEILKIGGNAVDAAVAVGFALAVTHPTAGNLGGGGFMVIRLTDGTETTIDFREKAPSKAHRNMYIDDDGEYIENMSRKGWSSSGVPGSVAGLLYALDKYGTLTLSEVIRPAIKLAEEGFAMHRRMAASLNSNRDFFSEYESTRKIFVKATGRFEENEILIQKDLANTLNLIKERGKEGFYEGKIARMISDQSLSNGGFITLEDLSEYRPIEREPVKGTFEGYEIISMGPPSSGGIMLIQILNTLEKLDIAGDTWGSSEYIHLLVETFKYAYADRAEHLGDEDFYPVPKDWLISKEYAAEISKKINAKARPSGDISHCIPPASESDQTTHYSVADKNGNAVSTTVTLNSSYGNNIVVDGAGFFMNNEMDDFSAKPGEPNLYGLLGSEANSIEPGKRMLSSMTPTILLKDDKPFMIIGSPGGSTIITVVTQVILNVVKFNMDIQEAIDAPRIHHQWMPDRLDYEKYGLSKDVIENLIEKDHPIGEISAFGRAEGIIIDNKKGFFWGATDPRGYGEAVGNR